MGKVKAALLGGIENPGLKSDAIVDVLSKKYKKYKIINKSTANKMHIAMRRTTFHISILQKKNDKHLYVDSGKSFLSILLPFFGSLHKERAVFVREYLKKELSSIKTK